VTQLHDDVNDLDDAGHRTAAGTATSPDDGRYRWVETPAVREPEAEPGWDETDDELDDLDEDEEDDFEPEPLGPRARGSGL
jgi:hypothetical protein